MRMTTCAFICKYYLFFHKWRKNELLKKQLVKRKLSQRDLKITIDMAWPAIVESFFVAFAGLIDSLMVSSLGSYAVAAGRTYHTAKAVRACPFFCVKCCNLSLVARRRGEKKLDSANEILLTAILFIVIAAIISSIAFVFLPVRSSTSAVLRQTPTMMLWYISALLWAV